MSNKNLCSDIKPLVSIIIPVKNQHSLVENCLASITKNTHYTNYEIIVINNQSTEPAIFDLFKSINKAEKSFVINYDHRFNFSAINNFAVKNTNGEIVLFLNNDTEVISPEWLDEMVSLAIKPEIGAVGALLLYPNDTIQHAGVVLHKQYIATHAYSKWTWEDFRKNEETFRVQEFPAVTGACMAVERRKFEEVGGFDKANLPVAYNDIDFCLSLMEKGYKNVCTPHAVLYHYESATRGYDDTFLKRKRLQRDSRYMRKKWGAVLDTGSLKIDLE